MDWIDSISAILSIERLDVLTTILGLAYIFLEYKASIWLWAVGFIMELFDIILYYKDGLYADCGMEFYYIFMTIYGVISWKFGRGKSKQASSQPMPIKHFEKSYIAPWAVLTVVIWVALYFALVRLGSTVPVADAFTTALSFVGIWALARKYLEQWFIWIAVDAVTCVLYFYKGIPFKATLYGLYVVIAVMGYFRWRRMMLLQASAEA